MNKFEIKHPLTSTLGFVYLTLRTRLDDQLQIVGFSKSTVIPGFNPQFFINAEFADRAALFFSLPVVKELLQELTQQKGFRSLEFRDHSMQIQTDVSFEQVEFLFTKLRDSLEFSADIRASEDENNKRFDMYSPANAVVGLTGTIVLSLIFLATSIWLSGTLLNPELAVASLMGFNIPVVLLVAWFLRKKICKFQLPARAFKIHAVSTFILLMICGTSFELFLNSALDPTTPTELVVPITGKLEHQRVKTDGVYKHGPLIFEVSEYQYARIEAGRSNEVLNIHRGLFLQKWLSRKRLEY